MPILETLGLLYEQHQLLLRRLHLLNTPILDTVFDKINLVGNFPAVKSFTSQGYNTAISQ